MKPRQFSPSLDNTLENRIALSTVSAATLKEVGAAFDKFQYDYALSAQQKASAVAADTALATAKATVTADKLALTNFINGPNFAPFATPAQKFLLTTVVNKLSKTAAPLLGTGVPVAAINKLQGDLAAQTAAAKAVPGTGFNQKTGLNTLAVSLEKTLGKQADPLINSEITGGKGTKKLEVAKKPSVGSLAEELNKGGGVTAITSARVAFLDALQAAGRRSGGGDQG